MSYYNKYIENMHKFISDLDRYYSTEGTRIFLEKYTSLNFEKVIKRFNAITKNVKDRIKTKDITLFDNEFKILPGIDLRIIWQNLIHGQKEKVWVYLNIMQTLGESALKEQYGTDLEFNPYLGIGNDTKDFTIDKLNADISMPDNNNSKLDLNIVSSMGLDKMIDVNKFKDELVGMTNEDISNVSDNIEDILGTNINDDTKKSISNMITNIRDKVKTNKTQLSSVSDLANIITSESGNIKSEFEKNPQEFEKLWSSAQNIVKNVGFDPMSMMNNVFGNNGNNKMYVQMLKNMGMSDDEIKNIDQNKIMEMLQEMKK
jgi:hypothetical protein